MKAVNQSPTAKTIYMFFHSSCKDSFRGKGLKDFAWHLDNAAGKPDFTLHGRKIDVKTVKR
jgi:hypothetical protein